MRTPAGWRIALLLGPGMLVAATGVGAGDLATAAFTGSELGLAVLWAVLIGAGLKFVLNEGLARWQLATGTTLIEGCTRHFGRPALYLFLAYMLSWSFFVGAALISACGVTAHAIAPLSGSSATDKLIWGLVHTGAGAVLAWWGGYRLFEKVMGVSIGVMFVTVVATAVLLVDDWSAVATGLVVPRIPRLADQGLVWTLALIGGVGGTLTVLCYGYWIREEGREGLAELGHCRIDLAAGYTMTALFGLAMVAIGSRVQPEQLQAAGGAASLIVVLADELSGPLARWAFLLGAWAAVFSSLLGVWQSVPYLFADCCRLLDAQAASGASVPPGSTTSVDTRSPRYRAYLVGLASLPALGLWLDFKEVQKWYAVVGAGFLPLLALALLILNGRSDWVGAQARNRPLTTALLVATLLFFACGVLLGFS